MNKKTIIPIIIIAVVMIVIAVYFVYQKLSAEEQTQVFSTQKECELITSKKCSFNSEKNGWHPIDCAKEGEYTSGAVSPEYHYGCCEGLKGFDVTALEKETLTGKGLLCYDPNKGIPICKAVGTRSEGWYYSETGKVLRYEKCQ